MNGPNLAAKRAILIGAPRLEAWLRRRYHRRRGPASESGLDGRQRLELRERIDRESRREPPRSPNDPGRG